MRKETVMILDSTVMRVLAGLLYSMAPDHNPRNAHTIIRAFKSAMIEKSSRFMDSYFFNVNVDELYDVIESILLGIPEFKDLNLSQQEFEHGISVDDPKRSKYKFFSLFDVNDWYTDFIDLDAFIRNFDNELIRADKEDDIDDKRLPKGQYTFSCKYNCKMGNQICCEECSDKDTCKFTCTSSSEVCQHTLWKGAKIIKEEF